MATRKKYIRGISGLYSGTDPVAPDALIGRTTKDGLSLSITTTDIVIEEGGSDVPVETLASAASIVFTGVLQWADLKTLGKILGIAVTGDLEDVTTPTAEQLDIVLNALGNQAAGPYTIVAAGAGTGSRTYTVNRGKLALNGDVVIGDNTNQQLPIKLTAYKPDVDGTPTVSVKDDI